jgi:hypothetical protein
MRLFYVFATLPPQHFPPPLNPARFWRNGPSLARRTNGLFQVAWRRIPLTLEVERKKKSNEEQRKTKRVHSRLASQGCGKAVLLETSMVSVAQSSPKQKSWSRTRFACQMLDLESSDSPSTSGSSQEETALATPTTTIQQLPSLMSLNVPPPPPVRRPDVPAVIPGNGSPSQQLHILVISQPPGSASAASSGRNGNALQAVHLYPGMTWRGSPRLAGSKWKSFLHPNGVLECLLTFRWKW